MKFFLVLFSISCVFLITSCFMSVEERFELPQYTDFNYHEQLRFDIHKSLRIQINSCLSVVNIHLHQDDEVIINYAYNQINLKNDLLINFKDDLLNMEMNQQGFFFCKNKKDIHTSIIIYIPNDLIDLEINTNAYHSTFEGNTLIAKTFHYKSNVSQFILDNAEVNTLDIEILEGEVLLNHTISEKIDIYLSTGTVHFDNSEIYDIIHIKLNKGDIVLNRMKTSILNSEVTLGSTNLNDVEVSYKLNINHDQGNIQLKNTYCERVYLNLKYGDIYYENMNEEYIIDLIEFSMIEGETHFNVKGNITKV